MKKLDPGERSRPDPDAIDELPAHPLVGLLDNVRSIYNVGSMFRTADAVRARHLYLSGFTGTPEHPRLHKTALGAQDAVPWSRHEDPLPLVERLRTEGYTVAALEITDRPTYLDEISGDRFPLCLLVGNEVDGVRPELLSAADLALELPQYGVKHSVNVAVAFGVAAFDLVRTYRSSRGLAPQDPL